MPRSRFLRRLVAMGLLAGVSSVHAAGCITVGQTKSCLRDECRAGLCVHVGTYHTPTGISSELTVNSRPARSTHLNLRCLGGQQKEGVFMKCGGSSISVQACVRGGLFKKSRCDPWQSFSGN